MHWRLGGNWRERSRASGLRVRRRCQSDCCRLSERHRATSWRSLLRREPVAKAGALTERVRQPWRSRNFEDRVGPSSHSSTVKRGRTAGTSRRGIEAGRDGKNTPRGKYPPPVLRVRHEDSPPSPRPADGDRHKRPRHLTQVRRSKVQSISKACLVAADGDGVPGGLPRLTVRVGEHGCAPTRPGALVAPTAGDDCAAGTTGNLRSGCYGTAPRGK